METTTNPEAKMTINTLSDRELADRIEAACSEANRQYVAGLDTTTIDAEVDALFAEHERRS